MGLGARDNTRTVFGPLQADDPQVVGGYRLVARLGAGGMGRVYLSHTRGGRPVAVKVVRPELADEPDFRRRFGREMEAARRVRGAYTAELIDGDADGTPPWLATLYVPGPSLAEAVARRGPLPVPAVLWLMAGVAEALQAVHAAGIVHRDLKPSNVLLASDGPRVIDFGISLAADLTSYTVTGAAIGTPQYMAPEQAAGSDGVTAATDVFSLGQTVAFAALGEPLYGSGPAASVLYRIVHDAPDLERLPEEVRPILARCLAADPAERADLAEVVAWCRERLGSEPEPVAWTEVTGPEPTVPGPAPVPVPGAADPAQTWPLTAQAPLVMPDPATLPARQEPKRRTALVASALVTAGVLVVSVLAWQVMDGTRDDGARSGTGKGAGAGPSASASKSPSPTTPSSGSGSGSGSADRTGSPLTKDEAPRTSFAQGEAYPQVWLDAKNSVNIHKEPAQLKTAKGDIRFSCTDNTGCELKSDTSVFVQSFAKPGAATRDMCDVMLARSKTHVLPLAASANGTEICVKHRSGDVGVLVLQTKSTAMPDIAFVTADLTVWRKKA
ncbi:serine/threonine-protein kinase [Streptomyces xanthii]|uniref:Serine/threonine protein kinase n=1 Tax=Streptomyces xanthii TaxID=2768069 RepID=A0A7H1B6N9_9ACTN|nr:serine/threonine-protein kinase [Streptomyces xanthii]QNS04394.1 serine/threonine protein kinase [Streptomyces xanthii]